MAKVDAGLKFVLNGRFCNVSSSGGRPLSKSLSGDDLRHDGRDAAKYLILRPHLPIS